MADVFISYASEDRERARAIADALAARGWTVWWDRQILPGETFESVIERELAAADCILVLWSESSTKSHWAKAEAEEAMNRGVLVPALIDDVRIPIAFRHVQAASLVDWTPDAEGHAGFDTLDQSIRRLDRPDPVTSETGVGGLGVGRQAGTGGLGDGGKAGTGGLGAGVRQSAAAAAGPGDGGHARRGAGAGSPTGTGEGRRRGVLAHPLALAGGAVALVIAGIAGASAFRGGGDDVYDAADLDAAYEDVTSREHEALDNGYEVLIAWTVDEIHVDEPLIISFDADAGVSYQVLGSTTSECELDIDFQEAAGTSPPGDTFTFSRGEPGEVSIQLTVHSPTAETCAVGNGTYRRPQPAAAS